MLINTLSVLDLTSKRRGRRNCWNVALEKSRDKLGDQSHFASLRNNETSLSKYNGMRPRTQWDIIQYLRLADHNTIANIEFLHLLTY